MSNTVSELRSLRVKVYYAVILQMYCSAHVSRNSTLPCKCRFAQDLVHCFQAYRSVLPRVSMLSFTQLIESLRVFNSPQFYEMLPQKEIGITRTAKTKEKNGKKEKNSSWACSTGGACTILSFLLVFRVIICIMRSLFLVLVSLPWKCTQGS